MTEEQIAIKEAARNAAVDEYFKARPQLMRTRHEECLVEAGFNAAWQACAARMVPDELRKDAERYRWLREQYWNSADICVVRNPKEAVKLGHDCPSFERLDSFIDAAIAPEGE